MAPRNAILALRKQVAAADVTSSYEVNRVPYGAP